MVDRSKASLPSWESVSAALLQYAANEDRLHDVAALLARVLPRFLSYHRQRQYFPYWEEHGFHLTPVHFYSPIPDTRALTDRLWVEESALVGIDLNETEQERFLREVFPRYREECGRLPTGPDGVPHRFHLNNVAFDGIDAMVLYCMIRHFQPDLILEVGSGFSSRLSAEAALVNGQTRLVCIEPYPDPILAAGFPGLTSLIPSKVEDVDLKVFEQLGPNDILFIDSSHVLRIGGDVCFLLLEVLPRLRPGVVVHFHDIFLPGHYPESWVKEGFWFWSEQYVLQAFLCFNSEFEVLVSNTYLGRLFARELRELFPTSPWWNGGGSFWIRRKPASDLS
jgi:hypothetical protein